MLDDGQERGHRQPQRDPFAERAPGRAHLVEAVLVLAAVEPDGAVHHVDDGLQGADGPLGLHGGLPGGVLEGGRALQRGRQPALQEGAVRGHGHAVRRARRVRPGRGGRGVARLLDELEHVGDLAEQPDGHGPGSEGAGPQVSCPSPDACSTAARVTSTASWARPSAMARLARSNMLTTPSSVSTALGEPPSGRGLSGLYQARRAVVSDRRARSAASGSVGLRASARSSSTSAASTWPRSMCASAPTSSSRTSSRSSPALSRRSSAEPTSAWWPEVASTAPCLRRASRTSCGSSASVACRSAPTGLRVAANHASARRCRSAMRSGRRRRRSAYSWARSSGWTRNQPPALAVAHHQGRVVLEVGQRVARVAPLGERGGQRGGDGIAHAHREQHLDDLVGQRRQDLAHEVVGDRLPVAGEVGEEHGRVGGFAQRDAGQAQRRGPARGLRVQQPVLRGGDAHVGPRQHGRGLVGGEGERGRAQLPQLAGEAQASQVQRWVGAAGQHQPQPRRPVLQEGREARDGVGVDQLLQVVEHDDQRPRHGHQRVDDGVEELRAAARHLGQPHGAQRVGARHGGHRREGGEHARPEPPVGVVLTVQGEPGDPTRVPGHPVGEQQGLAVTRGRRDQDDLAVAGLVEVVAEATARQVHRREVRDCRSDTCDRRAWPGAGAEAHDHGHAT